MPDTQGGRRCCGRRVTLIRPPVVNRDSSCWQRCRDGKADPEKFGILGMSGGWFVRGNVVRDLLALNKLEVSPWDSWRLATKDDNALTGAHLALCDRIAAVTQGDDVDLAEVRAIYATTEDVHLPPWLR